MKRLFFLVPDLKMTEDIAHELDNAGVNESHIHVLGGTHQNLHIAHLHPANLFQTTKLGISLKRGFVLGIFFAAMLYTLFSMALDTKVQGLGIAAVILFGIVFGVWASGMIGISVQNPVIEKYERYVKEGHYIM